MEFKKCARCGCFFVSNNDVCCKCEVKDSADIIKLNTFMDDSNDISSINDISISTGISLSNINRFIDEKKFTILWFFIYFSFFI